MGALAVALAIACIGCSADGSSATGPGNGPAPSTTGATAGAPADDPAVPDPMLAADRAVIERYVAAARDRDAPAALALRCASARPSDADRFELELDRLQDAVGDLSVVDVEVTPDVIEGPGGDARTRQVTLAYGGDRAPPQLLAVEGTGSEARLCGWSPGIHRLDDERRSTSGPMTSTALEDLLPDPGAGWSRNERPTDAAPPGEALTDVGVIDQASATWQGPGDRHWVVVQAARYESPQAAERDATTLLSEPLADAVATYDLSNAAPGALGHRVIPLGYLWVAPSDRWALLDVAVVVRGDTVITVQESGLLGAGHAQLTELVEQVDERARS